MSIQPKAANNATANAPAGERDIDLRELARRLGISLGTASRALNNRPGVSTAMRQRVLSAAREYGYSPNGAARLLKAKSSMSVGLFFAPYYGPLQEINPHALNLIEQVRDVLSKQGSELKVFHYQDDQTFRSQALEIHVGIFYGHFPETTLGVAHELKLPTLSFGKRSAYPGHVSVLLDAEQSCSCAIQYLAALGHERIGLMIGPTEEPYFLEYKTAYLSALKEFNLHGQSDWLIELPAKECNQQGARKALLPLLQNSPAAKRPTAMFFASDWLAIGGRRAALDAGLRIPTDFSLIGHDNLPITSELEPPLSTFDVHIDQIAQILAGLAARLNGHEWAGPLGTARSVNGSHEWLIQSAFIKRGSCACLRT